jgi:hypothetical protein
LHLIDQKNVDSKLETSHVISINAIKAPTLIFPISTEPFILRLYVDSSSSVSTFSTLHPVDLTAGKENPFPYSLYLSKALTLTENKLNNYWLTELETKTGALV